MNDADIRQLIEPDDGLTRDRHNALKEHVMALLTLERPDTASTPTLTPKRPKWRSRLLVGTAAVAVVVGGVAAAGGLFPEDSGVLPIGDCRTAASIQNVVATIVSDNGNTLELFSTQASPDAPVNGYALIETSPDGTTLGGSSGCNPPGTPDGGGDIWVTAPSMAGTDITYVWLYGKAPAETAAVEVGLDDGATIEIRPQTDGYFLTEVVRPGVGPNPDAPTARVPEPLEIRALGPDGRIILTQQL